MDFPIQINTPERDYPPQRRAIPWGLIEPHEKQALHNHGGQSLVRLAERGGLSAMEAVAVIEDKEYRVRWPYVYSKALELEAIKRLDELVLDYERDDEDVETLPVAGLAGLAAPSVFDTFVRILNEAYAADPAAIHSVICHRTQCNQQLADHPTVIVAVNQVAQVEYNTVDTLGIVNGICTALTGRQVAVKFSEPDPQTRRCHILGFSEYVPKEPVPGTEPICPKTLNPSASS